MNILDSILDKEILLSLVRFGAGFALVLGIGSWARAKKTDRLSDFISLNSYCDFSVCGRIQLEYNLPNLVTKISFFN